MNEEKRKEGVRGEKKKHERISMEPECEETSYKVRCVGLIVLIKSYHSFVNRV